MLLRITFLCLVAVLASVPATRADAAPRRIALVIGNDTYENVAPLMKARNDARAMTGALQGLGFDVVQEKDLDRRAISRALLELEKRIEPGDVALFYYAGHGFAIEGRNYLLPIDIPAPEPGGEAIVRDEAFLADDLADRLREAGASTAILVLDACRDNPFATAGKRSLAGSRGLARMSPSEGVFVLFSAGLNQAALDRLSDDDAHPNSVFTRTLLEELKAPGKTIVEIAKKTQVKVKTLAAKVGHDQAPAYYDQVIGDVVLNDASVTDGNSAADDTSTPDDATATIAESKSEVALLPPPKLLETTSRPAPKVKIGRSSAGWRIDVSLSEAALQFGYRIGESGSFIDNGTLDWIDPRTGQLAPNTRVKLDSDQGPTTLYVTWRDKLGKEAEAFPIAFDPEREIRSAEKAQLMRSQRYWITFYKRKGVFALFNQLVASRCGLKQVRFGFNGAAPEKIWEMPPCDLTTMFGAPAPQGAKTRAMLSERTTSVTLLVEFYDGEQVTMTYPVKF